jgi:hypothetical protein
MISASSETRDQKNPISPHQISLQSSFIEQKIQPIRCLRPIVLGLRQGQAAAASPYPYHSPYYYPYYNGYGGYGYNGYGGYGNNGYYGYPCHYHCGSYYPAYYGGYAEPYYAGYGANPTVVIITPHY